MTDSAAWPWEAKPPDKVTAGFLITVGPLKLNLGYAMYPTTVMLFCTEQIGTNPPTLWRRLWVPKHSALRVADDLIAEAYEYAESIGQLRPYEDLEPEDYLEHLRLGIENVFN